MRPAWLITTWKGCWSFILTKLLNLSIFSGIYVIQVLMVRTLAKVNSVLCMCTTTLGQQVDDWLQCLAMMEIILK